MEGIPGRSKIIAESGKIPFATKAGGVVLLEFPLAGQILNEPVSREILLRAKTAFIESLDGAVQGGVLMEPERKVILLNFLLKNPLMMDVFDIQ